MYAVPKKGTGEGYLCEMKLLFFIIGLCMTIVCQGQISQEMQELIKKHEGLSTEVYMDGKNIAVGYGHHIRYTEMDWVRDLEPGMEITIELAESLFNYDMLYLVGPGLIEVKKEIGWDYPQNVYDVMGSIIYNIGLQGLKSSEFYRLFKEKEYEDAFIELLLLKSRDKGIRKRRTAELKMLLSNYHPKKKKYILHPKA